jgi:asparagine synthase (glutamine-hydrolysing)
MQSELPSEAASALFASHLAQTDARSHVNRMLYVDTKLWLPDYLLLRADKLTMANSLEARVPFLDHALVEFAARLPTSLKLRGGVRKFLLKKVASKLLPREIVHRKKQGFPIPIGEWMRGDARSFIRDLLSPHSIQQRGLFDGRQVAALIRQHESGVADHSVELWGLANVELWQRAFHRAPEMFADAANRPRIASTNRDVSYG